MDLIEAISKKKFIVLGRAGMDMFAAPVGVKSEHAETFQSGLGGSSANICVGLSKFGHQASLATSVSDDAVGRFCINQLRQYGVETAHVKLVGGECRTSLAVYESTMDDFQNVIYRNDAADFQVSQSDMDEITYGNFGALITTGTVFAKDPSRSATFHAFEKARAAGLPIIFDIDYRPYSWASPEEASDILSRAGDKSDLICGNDEEFAFMAGGADKALAKARSLSEKEGRIVIYKMGEGGAITFHHGEEIRTGIYPVEPVKPNGAGDSFMAGFLAGVAQDRPLKEAVLRGSACAAIVVSKPGCAPAMPDLEGLEDFLANHPGVVESWKG